MEPVGGLATSVLADIDDINLGERKEVSASSAQIGQTLAVRSCHSTSVILAL